MDKDLQKLVLYAMQIHYSNGLLLMNDVIKDYFDAVSVEFLLSDDIPFKTDNNLLIIPIIIDEVCYGYYKIYDSKINRNDSISFITALLTTMHTNIIDYTTKTEESYFDSQTGLYNKNFYHNYCKNLNIQMINSISCIFVDINGLHEINNTEGHIKGDQVINLVASVLLEKYGKDDIVFRVGGDEFVVMITGKDLNYTTEKFEDIKEQLRKKGIYISMGYEYQKYPNINISTLIKKADENMYDDKANFYANSSNNRRSRK